jgi:hypothetical protein
VKFVSGIGGIRGDGIGQGTGKFCVEYDAGHDARHDERRVGTDFWLLASSLLVETADEQDRQSQHMLRLVRVLLDAAPDTIGVQRPAARVAARLANETECSGLI